MPIKALAPGVVVALGSAQVLTSAASLVKELLDNALDAHAQAVFVEISSNTLDCVQVKDNGHGVPPEDRENVARRYYTSKIKDLADLRALGGRSLGFRGEALASAAEMSGRLEIVTRTDGEVAAVKLTIGAQGQVLRYDFIESLHWGKHFISRRASVMSLYLFFLVFFWRRLSLLFPFFLFF
jgi:DNA mismatch repair ATPase MutL